MPFSKSLVISGLVAAWAMSGPKPPNMKKTIPAPTARKAASFTTDSAAMASMRPR